MRSVVGALLLWALGAGLAAACSSSISKRPARPGRPGAPSPAPAPAPPPSPRTNVTFPTYKCPHPYSEYYCLNDAECFTIIIQDNPLYNCECKDGFVGQRCEYKDLEGSYFLTRKNLMLETASIASGAIVALVVVGALVGLFAWFRSRRRAKACDESASSETRPSARMQAPLVT